MSKQPSKDAVRLLQWRDLYREAELYKAAVRLYTKPLFLWRKALNVSTDGKTLYDLAAQGLKGLAAIHEQLRTARFRFRPAVGLKYNFNGKRRTLYIPPWEERVVDLLIYRLLNRRCIPGSHLLLTRIATTPLVWIAVSRGSAQCSVPRTRPST